MLPAERGCAQMPNPEYSPGVKVPKGTKRPLKCIDQLIWGLWGRGMPSPLDVSVYTAGGWPAVSTPVLRSLAGKPEAAQKELALREGSDPNRLPGECTHFCCELWKAAVICCLVAAADMFLDHSDAG